MVGNHVVEPELEFAVPCGRAGLEGWRVARCEVSVVLECGVVLRHCFIGNDAFAAADFVLHTSNEIFLFLGRQEEWLAGYLNRPLPGVSESQPSAGAFLETANSNPATCFHWQRGGESHLVRPSGRSVRPGANLKDRLAVHDDFQKCNRCFADALAGDGEVAAALSKADFCAGLLAVHFCE